jgi:hypothetical protein
LTENNWTLAKALAYCGAKIAVNNNFFVCKIGTNFFLTDTFLLAPAEVAENELTKNKKVSYIKCYFQAQKIETIIRKCNFKSLLKLFYLTRAKKSNLAEKCFKMTSF